METNNQRLMTKFFYKNNQLIFQILVKEGEESCVVNEYTDYSTYKNTFAQLQQQLSENGKIDFGTTIESNKLKVA